MNSILTRAGRFRARLLPVLALLCYGFAVACCLLLKAAEELIMATDPNEIQLTEEQRAKLAERAELTGRSWQQLLEEMFSSLPRNHRVPTGKRSLFDVLQERGMIGAMEGPGDLSTNPKHMEGFGEPRYPEDSD